MKNKPVSLVDQLFKKPKKNKGENITKFRPYPENFIHQADLLFLPDDNGYKYCLVVVDDGTRTTDAEPLKNKTSDDVMKAFKIIYKRKILKLPKLIELDAGSEFKAQTKNYFDDLGVKVRYAKVARHKQQALVERKNQALGKLAFKRMTEEELLTGEISKQWVDDLPFFVKFVNEQAEIRNKKNKNNSNEYQCQNDPGNDACNLLSEGQMVRVILDHPIAVHDESRLYGKFRDSDIRWEKKPRQIMQVIIEPNEPPMYLVSMKDDEKRTDHGAAYTKNELLPVQENEIAPRESAIRPQKVGNQNLYYIEGIIGKKKEKNRIHYLVKFKGIKEPSWELKTDLIKTAFESIEKYEDENKEEKNNN